MTIKQVTIPISLEHPQPTKVSLKSLEGDLDVMVRDLNKHISGAATMTGAETLENKTLTSPTIQTPTITTPAITGDLAATGLAHFHNATTLPAGGSNTVGIKMGTSGIGMFFGTGVPTLTAPQGSLYIRADGTTTNDRFYIRTASGWTAGTTAT